MSLELAIRHAKRNPIKRLGRNSISRFACVLTDGYSNYIGTNSYRSHPLQARFAKKTGCPEKICIHAEISAIAKAVQAKVNLADYKMYIARVLANGEPALARPCESCMAAITEFGITEVEYTT